MDEAHSDRDGTLETGTRPTVTSAAGERAMLAAAIAALACAHVVVLRGK